MFFQFKFFTFQIVKTNTIKLRNPDPISNNDNFPLDANKQYFMSKVIDYGLQGANLKSDKVNSQSTDTLHDPNMLNV